MEKVPVSNLDFGRLLGSLGLGIATAQEALDKNSFETARQLGTEKIAFPSGKSRSLLELGVTPKFYQFSEAMFETRMSVSMTTEREESVSGSIRGGGRLGKKLMRALGVPANGSYSSRYQYSGESSSSLAVRMAAMPAPNALMDRVRSLNEMRRAMDD